METKRRRRRIFVVLIGLVVFIVVCDLFAGKRRPNHFYNVPSFVLNMFMTNITEDGQEPIWPEQCNETHDRISNQIRFMDSYSKSGKVNNTKLKLIYQVPHSNYGNPPGEGPGVFASCPIKACSLTRKQEDIKKADAVYLEGFESSKQSKLLPKPSHQVWIIIGGESPPLNTHMNVFDSEALGNLINWTVFYRRDSTIPIPSGKFETFPNFTRIENYPLTNGINYASGKTKKVAWFVSNCNYAMNSGRGNYAKELSKYIAVDIYGKCGTLKCPKDNAGGCRDMLRKDYKFYLSFENNCCKDYITEKFFHNALTNDVLPIALGAAPEDYKALAPPASYIHVDDFESPKELAEYLHLLDKNDTLYNEYFRWKNTGTFLSSSHWCRICALLHANDDLRYIHWYPNFRMWWEEGICLAPASSGQWQSWRKRH